MYWFLTAANVYDRADCCGGEEAAEGTGSQQKEPSSNSAKREVKSMEPEYTDQVHDIMQRIGQPVKRSCSGFAGIHRPVNGYKNLADLSIQKQAGSALLMLESHCSLVIAEGL